MTIRSSADCSRRRPDDLATTPKPSSSGEGALARLEASDRPPINLLILDLVMPDLDGMGVLARMRQRDIAVPAIVQTAHGSIEAVISAMRAGAIDFVVKPVGAERLQVSIRNALRVDALEDELRRATRRNAGELSFRDIVSRAESMARTIRLAERAAKSNIPVLIEGKSGVGKELMARAIQGGSERRGKPFVIVNCGALPENSRRIHPVRARKRLIHWRHRQACGQVRRGERRHAVPR